ncbi:MAG: DUF1446 domain-containing protein [Acidimicrobiia bacterium]|nr:DUF1446 domain-containing protein [Acidimicrobiia bacterium]
MAQPIRIANCSGFLGDRHTAAYEMVTGGPIDVLTGDYLAELTMAILARQRLKDPDRGYARQFLDHMGGVLELCLDKGIKVVVNAGGLNPQGLAAAVAEMARSLGREARVAAVSGDDLMPQMDRLATELRHNVSGKTFAELGSALTANAYLGGWGITAGLEAGADIVVTGRVSDASLVVGPAAWHHGWAPTDFDLIAGAVAAGHVIECGAQATGGNYSFLAEVEGIPGFPIAEVAEDGSAVITKHPNTGGLVSTGTVTAQLLYEIGAPAYPNPDVVAHLDTLRLEQVGENRVKISGTKGSAPPATTKVSATSHSGFRNSMTMIVAGMDIEAKAEMALNALWSALGGAERFDEVDVQLLRTEHQDPPNHEAAFAYLKVTVVDRDGDKVGRRFSNAVVELVLASYPGFTLTSPPGAGSPVLEYWPSLVAQPPSQVDVDGTQLEVAPPPASDGPAGYTEPAVVTRLDQGPTIRVPIGRVVGARSGDKGGDANLGVWARSDAAYEWLAAFLTTERLRQLLPETEPLQVDRYLLPNLRAINFLLVGYLGDGVSSSNKLDPQGKALGEYFRAKVVDIPEALLAV